MNQAQTTRIDVPDGPTLEAFTFGDRGCHATILAGVHGDEWEGVLAARALVERLEDEVLLGRVSVLPRSNPAALGLDSRLGPDQENLARSFPGDPGGNATERIAAAIARQLIDGTDLLIDLHSAGRNYLMPPLIGLSDQYRLGDTPLLEAALLTPMPFVWVHPSIGPGRSVSHADRQQIPWVYFESGCGGALSQRHLDLYVDSVLWLLAVAGILGQRPAPDLPPRRVLVTDGDGDTDTGVLAAATGRFVRCHEVGDSVQAGDRLGALHDDHGRETATVTTMEGGRIMMLRHEQRVFPGEVLAIVAAEEAPRAP